MISIFGLSSIPDYGKESNQFLYLISPSMQNFLHIPEFGILAYLWMQAFDKNKGSLLKGGLWTMGISISYGFLDEIHQLFIPGRYVSFSDIVLDTTGIIIGIITYGLFKLTKSTDINIDKKKNFIKINVRNLILTLE